MQIYFLTVNFMKTKHWSSMSKENLASELRDSVSVKYTLYFKELLLTNVKCLNNKCPINYMLTW